jgi:hypothetical protein
VAGRGHVFVAGLTSLDAHALSQSQRGRNRDRFSGRSAVSPAVSRLMSINPT